MLGILATSAPAAARNLGDVDPGPASEIACGETVTGSVSLAGAQRFTFDAFPRDVVAIDAIEIGGSGELLQLVLAGPGVRVSTCTGRIDPISTALRLTRLDGGRYGVLVRGCLDDHAVDFALSMNVVSASQNNCGGEPLHCGETLRRALEVPGEVDAYRLFVPEDTYVSLYLDSSDEIRGGLEVRVFDPEGQPVGDRFANGCMASPEFVAETSGLYTILLNACWGTATGPYGLRWVGRNCPAAAMTATPTTTHTLPPTATPTDERPSPVPTRTPASTATPARPSPVPTAVPTATTERPATPTATAASTPVPTRTTALATATQTPGRTLPPATCAGDCDGDGSITVDEILTLVAMSLGATDLECDAGDLNADGRITVDEVVTAVTNALNGCPA